MSESHDYIQVNLSSADQVSSGDNTSAHVIFEFSTPLQPPSHWEVAEAEVEVLNATIPHSWYNISETHNQIDIAVIRAGAELGRVSYVVEAGEYSGAELQAYFNDAVLGMQAQIDTIPGIGGGGSTVWAGGDGLSIPNTGYFNVTFTAGTAGDSLVFMYPDQSYTLGSSSIVSLNTTLTAPIGFTENFSVDDGDTTILPSIIDLSGTKSLYFTSQIPVRNRDPWTNLNIGSTLSAMQIHTSFGELNNFAPNNPAKNLVNLDSLTYLEIRLLDDNGELINLHNANWTATLQIHFIRKEPRNSRKRPLSLNAVEFS